MPDAADILGADGPFAARLTDFVPRACQQEMAQAIAGALADHATLVVESGTGTGKTFAYLVPALLSGKKVLISTGTKHLQEQLFHRDLALIRTALGRRVTTERRKGRGNDLCLHRLASAELEGRFGSRREAGDLTRIRDWAGRTNSGDIGEMSEVSEDSTVWPRVTSTPENCLGGQCREYDDCHVNRARREALAADVLVVNHHLFFADLALREEGFAQLLPGVEVVIFDEAHQPPEIASNFWVSISPVNSCTLSAATPWSRITRTQHHSRITARGELTEKAVADFRLSLGVSRAARLGEWRSLPRFSCRLDDLKARLGELAAIPGARCRRARGSPIVGGVPPKLLDRLFTIRETRRPTMSPGWRQARGFACTSRRLRSRPVSPHPGSGREDLDIHVRDLDRKRRIQSLSGAVGSGRCRHRALGEPSTTPGKRSYIPEGAEPSAARLHRTRAGTGAAGGTGQPRAAFVFTSHRALKLAAEWFAGKLDYPLLVQGTAPRSELLERFRAAGNAVLLGTGSFWEGVDVRGEALSCVIIDKLPFATPDDPVLQARAAAMEQAGLSAFKEYQLPNAVIALKQGMGRLIRDSGDRGVLMLCDPRLLSKGYGKIFLASLPPMLRTRAFSEVQKFFAAEELPPVDRKSRQPA